MVKFALKTIMDLTSYHVGVFSVITHAILFIPYMVNARAVKQLLYKIKRLKIPVVVKGH